jgi:hypothetical protein
LTKGRAIKSSMSNTMAKFRASLPAFGSIETLLLSPDINITRCLDDRRFNQALPLKNLLIIIFLTRVNTCH